MSDIVYTPPSEYNKQLDTIPTKQNLFSYLALYGTRISEFNLQHGTGTKVLYTVPTGQTLFIVAVHGNLLIEQHGGSNGYLYIGVDPTESLMNLMTDSDIQNTCVNSGVSFPIPIRAQSGESIRIYCDQVNSTAQFTIQGYLVDNSLMNTFN